MGDVAVGSVTGTGLFGAAASNATGAGKSVESGLGNLGNEITGGAAKDRALAAQQAATDKANAFLNNTYQSQQSYLDPYSQAGGSALTQLASGKLMDGQSVLNNDAGYQFRLDEGNKAINAAAAARGMGNSGATLKALTKYGQDYASGEYDKAYQRQYNTLSQLAGYGSAAATNQSGNAGAYGASVSNNYTGLGNAQASANIGQYNTLANLAGQGAQAAARYCDENLKTSIEPLSAEDLKELQSVIKPYVFKYKDEAHGEGIWIGPMAQDLQKSKIGKELVFKDAEGNLKIDLDKAVVMMFAIMGAG